MPSLSLLVLLPPAVYFMAMLCLGRLGRQVGTGVGRGSIGKSVQAGRQQG